MSEPKVVKIELNNHGKPIASIQGTTSYYGISPNDTFYPQAEADKIFRRLKARLARKGISNQQLEIDKNNNWHKYCQAIIELRHSNHKRCLAMASKCRLRARWFGDNAFYKKEQWALQWHRRWLELAEKFKEVK